jgi:hypothetical protein
MYYDMNNTQKSWRGAPVTNLLPTPAVNSVPTTGNGWGTYNTNQYGSGAYFSIGTVASVSGNIVTMTAAHSLRSYDVMQPQSTGGGVTAGTNYLIKKLSSTTFSLHPYNSSQDGSQGYINPATGTYKVYDDFANNVQISINATSFPTMWWGYPHLPNSGLVKEVRTNGCSIPGYPTTDCLRLYHTRPDGVTDGMAYGVDTPVTAGVAHTVSFWTKTVNAAAVGQYISYQIYNYGVVSPTGYSFNAVLGPVGVWVKQSMTFTPANPTAISYFFPSSGNIIYDLAHIQFETGSTASSWSNSSRSTTQALSDLTGKNTFTISSLTYSSNNTNSFSFNGSTNTIDCGNSAALQAISGTSYVTVEAWVNLSGYGSSSYGVIAHKGYPWAFLMENPSNTMRIRFYLSVSGDVACPDSATHALNTWYHFVGTYDGSNMRFYRNGVFTNSIAGTGTLGGSGTNMVVGSYSGAYFSQGQIPVVKVYNRTLSATEIQQNFNALRNRYGI